MTKKTNEEIRDEMRAMIEGIPDDKLQTLYRALKMTGAMK
jgi:hypothetical protein